MHLNASLRTVAAAALLTFGPWASSPAAAQLLVVANKSDATVDLLDLASGESVATIATGRGPHEVAVSPDGKLAVVTDYGDREQPGSTLTVIDLAARRALRTVATGEHQRPHGVQFLDGDRIVVTAEGSRHLLIVEVGAGAVTRAIETGQEISHMVAATPDGRRAFVANIGSGSVTVIDLEAGTKLRDVATGDGAEGIAITPDGGGVWVTNRAADTVTVLDSATLEIVAEIACPGFPIRVEITPDGRRALVSAARSGEVVIFDTGTRAELARSRLDLENAADAAARLFGDRFGESPVPVGIQIGPDGSRAWVAATQADAVVEIDTETLAVTRVLSAGHEPDGMAYSPLAPE